MTSQGHRGTQRPRMQRSTCFLLAYLVAVSARAFRAAGAVNSVAVNSSCQLTVVGISAELVVLTHCGM